MSGKHKSVPCMHCGDPSRRGRCWPCYLIQTGKKVIGGSFDHLVYNVDPISGCWVWSGPTRGWGGYGYMKNHERSHRYSYRTHKGSIPDGLFVLHKCDNPPCVNPDHLFLGTHQDNMRDKKVKGRAARGERNPNAKISESHAKEIIQSRETPKALAARYGVHVTHINRIKRHKKWAHLQTEVRQ